MSGDSSDLHAFDWNVNLPRGARYVSGKRNLFHLDFRANDSEKTLAVT